MNVSRTLRIFLLPAALNLAACDAHRVTAPESDTTALGAEDRIALELIDDSNAVQAAMDLIEIPLATAARHGMARGAHASAAATAELARERFREAVRAMNGLDSVQAAERAREARRLVVQAMVAVRGRGAVSALVDRAEDLYAAVAREPGMYTNSYQLGQELSDLALRARERLQLRDSIGAGECAVLAEQRHRQRHGGPAAPLGGAVVAVELGHTSVTLASGLVNEAGPVDDGTSRLLAVAADYADAASAALEAGREAWAVQLSDLAQWTALQAVVGLDGVSADEASALLALAETSYAEAAASTPTGLAADLLERARILIDFASTAVDRTRPHGIGALWRAAVICAWIIG